MAKVLSGTLGSSKDDPRWNLYGGSGPRATRLEVHFSPPFTTKPTASVGLNVVDIIAGPNSRLSAKIVDLTKDHMQVEFMTWADTQVWAASVHWIAIQP
jgi:hypothetical protein